MISVSVILSTGPGAGLAATLRSLANQDLGVDRFEVIVVGGKSADVAPLIAQQPTLGVRRLVLPGVAPARARHLAVHSARGLYVTFVDAGDTVSPQYLRALFEASGPSTVGLASVVEVIAGGRPVDVARAPSGPLPAVAPTDVPAALATGFGKMAPAAAAALASDAGDEAFWVQLLAETSFEFGVGPLSARAVYTRRVPRDERASASFDVRVNRHLDVIAQLERVRTDSTPARGVIDVLTLARTRLINNFLRLHPYQHGNTIAEIRRRELTSIRFDVLNEGIAHDLAILYAAPPAADTSARVAARRMREAAVVRDVVSNDMASELALDPRSELIWREFVDREYRAPTTPVWGWWPGVIKFCRLGRKQIRQWEQEKGPYRSVYSRAMWPAAHLLAALYKADNPQTRWIAEFSDPLMYDVKGERRESKGELEPAFRTELSAALRTRGLPPPDSDNTYVWIETLVYALADTVLFTNDHQRDYMLGYFPDRRLAGRGAEHAVIEPHPTLPAEFYEVAPSPYSLDPGLVNIAYFGAFYASRGLTEVVEALRALSPATRARVRLHVFTRKPDEIAEEMRGAGLSDVVVPNPFVNYLEFLNLTTRFDALLVNDARTLETHGVNPYLPSKWSDYVGSGRPIWAIVEPGSVLSTRPMAYRSELGDADGARVVLERLVADSIGAVPAP